jgi:hypothetical protein
MASQNPPKSRIVRLGKRAQMESSLLNTILVTPMDLIVVNLLIVSAMLGCVGLIAYQLLPEAIDGSES